MASWTDRFTQVTQSAISKSKEVAGVTKLNMEISSLNQEIKNIQVQVGAYVLDNGFLTANPYISDWAEKVNAFKAEIEAKNEKILELKNVVVCTGCGREVSRSNRFCEHCGAEIVIKAPVAEAAEVTATAATAVAEGAAAAAEVASNVEAAAETAATVVAEEAAGVTDSVREEAAAEVNEAVEAENETGTV